MFKNIIHFDFLTVGLALVSREAKYPLTSVSSLELTAEMRCLGNSFF